MYYIYMLTEFAIAIPLALAINRLQKICIMENF